MAHPHSEHRAHHASRKRVGHIMKSGGQHHADAAADKKLFADMIRQHEAGEMVPGERRGGRIGKYARGGAAKGKKHGNHVNIAIVTPQARSDHGVTPGGPGASPPVPAPGPAPVLPPGAGPPMAGPPGLMKPPGMMKRGGGVKMTAGAYSGEGRLEKAEIQKRKRK